jgi:hypothetical protein
MNLFGGVRRRPSFCLNRPVAPEVAGSSPVAPPLKSLQIGILCCRVGRQIAADYTHFSRRDDETAKTARYAVAGRRFQADSGRVQTDREGGMRRHRMTGGHAAPPLRRRSTGNRRVRSSATNTAVEETGAALMGKTRCGATRPGPDRDGSRSPPRGDEPIGRCRHRRDHSWPLRPPVRFARSAVEPLSPLELRLGRLVRERPVLDLVAAAPSGTGSRSRRKGRMCCRLVPLLRRRVASRATPPRLRAPGRTPIRGPAGRGSCSGGGRTAGRLGPR